MRAELLNISDFALAGKQPCAAPMGRAQIYRFPNSIAAAPQSAAPVIENIQSAAPAKENTPLWRRLTLGAFVALGAEVAAILSVYAIWLLWYLHR